MHRLTLSFLASSVLFLGVALAALVHTSQARGIVEVEIDEFGPPQIDRCPTCHAVPRGAEYPTGHPKIYGYHPVERFGCASCHGGEPRAVDKHWAHSRGREPLLHKAGDGSERPERLEAGCARCHLRRTDQGLVYDPEMLPHVARGFELFLSRGCWGCHRITEISLGERGPDLSNVGARLDGDAISVAIEDPSAAPSSTTMPRFRLPDEDRRDLVTFLLAQVDHERRAAVATARLLESRRPGAPPQRQSVNQGMAQGGEIMLRLGCSGCHRLQTRDGHVGPDLRLEGDLRGPRFLKDMLTRPSSVVVGSRMPPFDLTASELEAVVQYLGHQRETPPSNDEAVWDEICARCHGLDGRGRTAVAPYLARRPRDLSSADFFSQVEPSRIVRSIRQGVVGTPMAPWAEVVPLLQGKRVISLISKRLQKGVLPAPRRLDIPRAPEKLSDADRAGAERMFSVECSSCHGPYGRGDGPEAPGLRPKPRDLGNSPFIKSLSDRRIYSSIAYGAVGSAMPSHILGSSPNLIWALVEKVRTLAGEAQVGSYDDDAWPWNKHKRTERKRGAKSNRSPRRGQRRRPPSKAPLPAPPERRTAPDNLP